jgi:integrase
MVNVKISIHSRNLKARKEGVKSWDIAEEDKKDLLKFLDDSGLGKVNKGVKISETRQLKYLDIIKTPLEFFKKPCSRIALKDVEVFEKALSSNKILSYKKKPFFPATKVDIRRILKIYLKWKLGNNEKFRQLTEWFDTRETKRTPDFLSESEVEKLYKNCKDAAGRYLIAVLFDGGLRAEEFHNVRYEDIQLPNANEHYPKITIKAEYSKTEGRTISLFWKHSLEAVRDYVKERETDVIKSSDPVFNNSYDNTRQFLIRLGNKALGKPVHYHLFRHSSATYYANKLNRQQICYRYGWKFSSDMPDVYISRSGMENKELDERFASTELEEIKRESEKIKTEMGITKADFEVKISEMKKENLLQGQKIDNLTAENRSTLHWLKKVNDMDTRMLRELEIIKKAKKKSKKSEPVHS